jgi:glycosyltransferase involved in cell wall biosynthesis
MPTVSVVIPTYNRADVLPRAIDSVLNQTFEDFELIIVDDASTDSTEKVVNSYTDNRLRFLQHEINKNGSAARNTGIKASEGDYIAFLDSDDEWHPEKLEKQIQQLNESSEDWVANYCGVTIDRSSKIKSVLSDLLNHDAQNEGQDEVIRRILSLSGFVHGGSTLVATRSVVSSIGGFDESFHRNQDIEFTIRLARAGKVARVDDELVTLHESGRPDPDAVAESKVKLFTAFEDEIDRFESQGYDIRKYHRLIISRYYLGDGQWQNGFRYLRGSKPANVRQVLGLCLDVSRGLKKSITQ